MTLRHIPGLIVRRLGRLLATAVLLLTAVPGGSAADRVCELENARDPPLQAALEALLERQGLDRYARSGELALTLLLLHDDDRPRLAQVNGHRMMYAASLPKIAILLGAADALERGALVMDPSLGRDLHDMIRYSCNDCANRVLEKVGREQLLQLLLSPRYAFYDAQGDGGLWVGKDFGPVPAYRRDPLFGLSHGATTFQVARFYCGLERGTLVSESKSRMMLEVLAEPGLEHKFVRGMKPYKDARIFRKSGTWKSYHADSMLVRLDGRNYVAVAIASNPAGGDWLENLAGPLHELATSSPQSWGSSLLRSMIIR